MCSKVVPVVTSFSDAVAKDEHFILSGLPIILSTPFGLSYISEQLKFHCTLYTMQYIIPVIIITGRKKNLQANVRESYTEEKALLN